MSPLRIGLIGAGVMGANHARVIGETEGAELAVVVDIDGMRAQKLADQVGCTASTSIEAAMSCDACIVASPTEHHVDAAVPLILAGRPVLVEKPLAPDLDGAKTILEASDQAGTPISCGFVERFNPAVTTAAQVLLDQPVHIVAIRHSPPAPRMTTSVVHDLLIHDIDLAQRFMGGAPAEDVVGMTVKLSDGRSDEVADCCLRFSSGALALLSSSRLSQRKVRLFHIEAASSLVEIDLLRQDVTVYRHVRHEQVVEGSTYRAETIVDIPFVRHAGEPLQLQLKHFLALIDGRADQDRERRSLLPAHEIADRIVRRPPAP
jgi:predicted dehydrogenase